MEDLLEELTLLTQDLKDVLLEIKKLLYNKETKEKSL